MIDQFMVREFVA